MAAPHSIDQRKRALRAALRRSPPRPPGDQAAALALRDAVRELVRDSAARRVAAFLPIGDEPDLRPLFRPLVRDGVRVLLPMIAGADVPLRFRPWEDGGPLANGPFGTRHPADGPDEAPDLVLVPLLAFDHAGRRLGRGGGFYDRTLAALGPVTVVGVAWDAREIGEVPDEPHDVALDAIVTEGGLRRFARQEG